MTIDTCMCMCVHVCLQVHAYVHGDLLMCFRTDNDYRHVHAHVCVCMCMCMYSYIVTRHHTLLVMDSDNRDSLNRHASFALDEEA